MDAIRKLLASLDYPYLNSGIDISDRVVMIRLVTWLEDRKIRELEIDDRDNLRIDNGNWDLTFTSYLEMLSCPFNWPIENIDCVFWLISYAVSLDYDDNITNKMAVRDENSISDQSKLSIEKIELLGSTLNLRRGANESLTNFVKRIHQVVKFYISDESIENFKNNYETPPNTFVNQVNDLKLSFDTKDDIVNKVALVLRMLYLEDFRELQNDVNCLIVLGQEYTANPRVNASLGKVGR